MKGDVPLNLASTSMMMNAFMYTGNDKYKKWVEEYVAGWMKRVEENQGFLPDNVGLSGKVGENMGGKKWGGYYGWRWPHGLLNQMEATYIGVSNAYLASGDSTYLKLPNAVIKLVEDQAKTEKGLKLVPHRYDDRGWWDYRPMEAKFPTHLWYISRENQDWERAKRLSDPKKSYYKFNTGTEQMVRGRNLTEGSGLPYKKGKGDSENTMAWMVIWRGKTPTTQWTCYEPTTKKCYYA